MLALQRFFTDKNPDFTNKRTHLSDCSAHNSQTYTRRTPMFNITCESTVDLPQEYLKSRGCNAIHYSYFVNDTEHVDTMKNTTKSLEEFYKAIDEYRPTTSQISTERYEEFFRQNLCDGDILHIAFGDGMSQSVFNATKAADKINAENGNKVFVVNSTCSCVGYGMLTDIALDLRDNGKTLQQIVDFLEQNKTKIHHQFFSTTLSYFRKSGRVSGPAALIGNLLKLCPIMRLNKQGKIIAYGKAMSVSGAITKTESETLAHIKNGKNYDGKLWISHSACLDTAIKVKKRMQSTYPKADVRVFDIGPIIACHCGPGTVAVYFEGDERP